VWEEELKPLSPLLSDGLSQIVKENKKRKSLKIRRLVIARRKADAYVPVIVSEVDSVKQLCILS